MDISVWTQFEKPAMRNRLLGSSTIEAFAECASLQSGGCSGENRRFVTAARSDGIDHESGSARGIAVSRG